MKLLNAILLLILSQTLQAQKLELVREFGNFKSASSFDIDLHGNFFVTDIEENSISKLDSSGNEIFSIGGYGWKESTFDEPMCAFTNTLSVYVADKNNNRIQRFDKDLNFLSEYSGTEGDASFAYPTCVAISTLGELYILDSDNNSVLQFNLNGNYLGEIGGNDAGTFALDNPIYFSVDKQSNIFVLDNRYVKVFDQYGAGLYSFTIDFDALKIHIVDNYIIIVGLNRLMIFDLRDRKIIAEITELPHNKLADSYFIDSYIYLLTSNQIFKYKVIF